MKRTAFLGFALGLATATVAFVSFPAGVPSTTEAHAVDASLQDDEQNTIAIFQAASPSVVHVENIGRRRDLFTMNVFEMPQGSGSGFIWDTAGHIVTNYHVVQRASTLMVTLHDGVTHEAVVVGVDPSQDLAVLRIDVPASALTPVAVGTSAGLMAGQKVLAIGNPFGLDHTLTTGIISALGREIRAVDGRTITGVIQTDAAINPGNSGGPLFNSSGEVIGVNAAIFSPSGASAGIGFAVPVDTVQRIVPQLVEHGRVIRPTLGVTIVNDAVARRFGINGVVVGAILPGSSAQDVGIVGLQRGPRGQWLLGDVIVAIDGTRVTNADTLFRGLEAHEVGDVAAVTVRRRDGAEVVLEVRLQADE